MQSEIGKTFLHSDVRLGLNFKINHSKIFYEKKTDNK